MVKTETIHISSAQLIKHAQITNETLPAALQGTAAQFRLTGVSNEKVNEKIKKTTVFYAVRSWEKIKCPLPTRTRQLRQRKMQSHFRQYANPNAIPSDYLNQLNASELPSRTTSTS